MNVTRGEKRGTRPARTVPLTSRGVRPAVLRSKLSGNSGAGPTLKVVRPWWRSSPVEITDLTSTQIDLLVEAVNTSPTRTAVRAFGTQMRSWAALWGELKAHTAPRWTTTPSRIADYLGLPRFDGQG
ncbi:MAG: hypothetical protein QOG18_1435, partial [Microbacteriaceae bacterium]|jgi:hypothetical protein|nr:hypothetical protein [Microbacteriaceae bacterium]